MRGGVDRSEDATYPELRMFTLAELGRRLAGSKPALSPVGHEEPHGGPAAAVAAILRPSADAQGAELFFIQRADREGDPWSGHVAFPGGRRELSDRSLLDTAIRETREEVGLDLGRAELVARLPDLPAIGRARKTNLVVTPFVFALHEDLPVRPNHEVKGTLWVPFEALARGDRRETFVYEHEGKRWDLPCLMLEGKLRLWGMTFRMLETLIEAVRAVDVARTG